MRDYEKNLENGDGRSSTRLIKDRKGASVVTGMYTPGDDDEEDDYKQPGSNSGTAQSRDRVVSEEFQNNHADHDTSDASFSKLSFS